MSKQDDAKQMVQAFASKTTGGNLWKAIPRAAVVRGLLPRIDNPSLISQGLSGTCGPASVIYNLAKDAPVAYARAVVQLWESGQTYIGTLMVKPGKDLLDYKLPPTQETEINPADWIILASLRDSENWFLDYQAVDDGYAGGTSGRELAAWLRKFGYQDVIDETTDFTKASLENAQRASALYAKGYKVILRINDILLDAKNPNQGGEKGNHIVVLISPIAFDLKTVPASVCAPVGVPGPRVCVPMPGRTTADLSASSLRFKAYTWGTERDVPFAGTLTLAGFLGSYFGFIAGKY